MCTVLGKWQDMREAMAVCQELYQQDDFLVPKGNLWRTGGELVETVSEPEEHGNKTWGNPRSTYMDQKSRAWQGDGHLSSH